MRKTLFAMVGLLALGLWALPAAAEDFTWPSGAYREDLPKVQEPTSLDNRAGRLGSMFRSGGDAAYKGTLSGTLIKQAQATTTWYLYPNACNERYGIGGPWAPKTSIIADSLNAYSTTVVNHGYQLEDQSLKDRIWHVSDGTGTYETNGLAPIGTPIPLDGLRSLWCGQTEPAWVVKSGYPNLTFQILYIDTGAHAGAWTLSWMMNVSTEYNYDYLYIIGGNGGTDPIGNSRSILDHIVDTGSDAAGNMLVTFTGSIVANPTLTAVGPPGLTVNGLGAGQPTTVTMTLSGISATHRAIYVLFTADCLYSSEDGLWPDGHGQILDTVAASDNGLIYDDQAPAGGTDAFDGDVIVGTPGAPVVSARVAPGVGTLWRISAGNTLPTSDFCSPQKQLVADKMFEGGDAGTHLTLANTYAAIKTCTFPVPTGVASVLAIWGEYLDLPRQSGFVQDSEYRSYRGGQWSNWKTTSEGVRTGALQAWTVDGDELAEASQADSVQLRHLMQCINFFAVDHVNCQPVTYGILYDDLRLQLLTGVPAPIFDIFVAQVPSTTFVDGTDATSDNCLAATIAAGKCWPGARGSDVDVISGIPASISGPIKDNMNNPYGDSLTWSMLTGIRQNGMGNNWKYGFSKAVNAGMTVSYQNTGYNAAYDTPRMIFRLYDPATYTWSAWDSIAVDANAATASGADTFVIDSEFRFDWPPRDKYYVNSGAGDPAPSVDLPLPSNKFDGTPGWTLNGKTLYSQVPFMPKGSRMQYYFKAVDVNGGTAYQFTTNNLGMEVDDLPTLPGSSIKAPDIVEWAVLPRVYPPTSSGQLAGKTDAEILNLDGSYSSWSNQFDPVTQALRAMGVRADRYRRTQGLANASGIGGHGLPGQRVDRLSDYFPNLLEYNIQGTLTDNYRIIIESSHLRTSTIFDEQDALLLNNWWRTATTANPNDGDRCLLGSGDDMFNALLNGSLSFPQHDEQVALAQNVFGVNSVVGAWSGANTNFYPVIDDRFAGGGPGLAAPNTYTYPIDGGCPNPNRFDALTKVGSADAASSAFYPGSGEVAGIARMSEHDTPGDNDRSKALAYGFSIQFIRTAGIPTTAANYVHTGVENRMRVLYKFLASCRRNTGAVTTPCWPCPSNPSEMSTNWATATGFNTGTYGDLYLIQDHLAATGVELSEAPKVNRLEGNVPNPFNPETAIRFQVGTPGKITIRIFDVAGRLVNTLSKNVTETGLNEIRWNGKSSDGRALASGMYFYRVRFGNGQETEAKMTMLK